MVLLQLAALARDRLVVSLAGDSCTRALGGAVGCYVQAASCAVSRDPAALNGQPASRHSYRRVAPFPWPAAASRLRRERPAQGNMPAGGRAGLAAGASFESEAQPGTPCRRRAGRGEGLRTGQASPRAPPVPPQSASPGSSLPETPVPPLRPRELLRHWVRRLAGDGCAVPRPQVGDRAADHRCARPMLRQVVGTG